MGNCFGKHITKSNSIIKLTCPYCNGYETYNTKKFDKHIMTCIELDKYFTIK